MDGHVTHSDSQRSSKADSFNLYREMSSIFILHDAFRKSFDKIKHGISLYGSDDEIPCISLTGPTGVGKSTLLKKLCMEFPAVPDGTVVRKPFYPDMVADSRPLIKFRMPPQPTVKAVARAMIKQYTSDPNALKGDRFALEDRVDEYTTANGTRGVLIDDAQRAVDRNGNVVTDDLADWFKDRHEANGAILIFFGLGRLQHMFENDSQIARRWNAPLRMDPYRWLNENGDPDLEGQGCFIGGLRALIDGSPVPFAEEVDVRVGDDASVDDKALRYFYASQGAVGLQKKLFNAAASLLIAYPEEFTVVDRRLLAVAYQEAFGDKRPLFPNHVNPFGPEWRQQLPPPMQDDRALLHNKGPARSKAGTKKARRFARIAALTKS